MIFTQTHKPCKYRHMINSLEASHTHLLPGMNRPSVITADDSEPLTSVRSASDSTTLPPAESVIRNLRLKVRRDAYPWLNAAAGEVNQVFNWCNETSWNAWRRTDSKHGWLTGYDLANLSAGASEYFEKIGADTIQTICTRYAWTRSKAELVKLRWRKTSGARRSLGWVPFKGKCLTLNRKGKAVRFRRKTFRVFESSKLAGLQWGDGCFAQDAVGDWWLSLPVRRPIAHDPASAKAVGIDLGLDHIATTSDGERLPVGQWGNAIAEKRAMAQRRGHKRQAKRLLRQAANRRKDALHKFSRKIVNQYQYIAVGDVSSNKLAKTWLAKAVFNAGWGMLKTQLQYKGQQAGRSVVIANERNSTRTCSSCRALTGPAGLDMLGVRQWCCSACGAEHDRDVNAAKNILAGSRCGTSVSGNGLSSNMLRPKRPARKREPRRAPRGNGTVTGLKPAQISPLQASNHKDPISGR